MPRPVHNTTRHNAGTTAFPSARWKGDNGPEQTDLLSASNLIRTVQEQSPDLKRFVLVSSVGVTRQSQCAHPQPQ